MRIKPDESIRQQIIDDSLRARLLPLQVQLQHRDAHVAEDLDRLENGRLVGVELFGDRPDVLLVSYGYDGEAGAEGFEGFDGAEDVVAVS